MLNSSTGFARFKLREALQNGIAAMKWQEPRPIQAQTIPAVLEGRDVLGLAETGTGKTGAFGLPILERLLAHPGHGVRALIVAPTRELAMQIDVEIRALARQTPIRTVTIYGGVSMKHQIDGLRRNPQIVVGCPGRLLDLHGQGTLKLHAVEVLVLDEADHLFDMGFLPDIRRILRALPPKRQNLLWSATMPAEIRQLASEILHHPHVVELSRNAPPATIAHELYPVAPDRKFDLLQKLISENSIRSAIVFTRTKHRARKLARDLERQGHRAVAIQGNMSQNARDRAMAGFRQGQFDILVATDLMARGIDVAQVSHVINFDIPNTPDAYTHRIGRTGRAERSGQAYTFITHEDRDMVDQIERRIGTKIPRRSLDGILPPERPRPAVTPVHRTAHPPVHVPPSPRPQAHGFGRHRRPGRRRR
jgi:superfamily II DNA/RNA helicase